MPARKRAAVIADSHFNDTTGGRLDECVRIHNWIADDIRGRDVDLVVHAGDLYERPSTPVERSEAAEWIQRITETAPFVIVRGNHDPVGDLQLLDRLKTEREVIVEERAGVHVLGGCVVGCMAWPSKASVLAMSDHVMGHEEGEQLAGQALRNVLLGLGQQMDQEAELHGAEKAPRILLSHAMVRGSKVSTGQPLVGCDMEIGTEDLRLARANFYALGHIHMPQSFGDDMAYPGSPRRTAYGEIEEKGYIVAEFYPDGTLATVDRVPTPCSPMLLWEGEYVPEIGLSIKGDNEVPPAGAEIRIRFRVDSDQQEPARAAAAEMKAKLLEGGAADVKVEPEVRSTVRAKAPEVARATTLPEKLQAYWASRGETPEPERKERLLSKLGELEASA